MRTVAGKELAETRRDRRTVIAAVLLPALLMPIAVLVIPVLARHQQAALERRPARVAVLGGGAGGLVAAGFDQGLLRLVSVQDPAGALLRGDLDAVLIDQGRGDRGPRRVVILYDESRPASRAALDRITALAARRALRDLEAAARARGIDPAALLTVNLEPSNVAPPRRLGATLLATALPFFLAVWLLLGGQYAALDVGVGERERGSLETLLAAPPARSSIVAGKFVAVLVPAVLALMIMLASGVASARLGAGLLSAQPVEVHLPLPTAGLLLLVGMALGGLLSALQLLASLGARTLREAQQAFTALYLLVAVPVALEPFLGEWTGARWVSLVPVLNAVLAVRRVLLGEAQAGEVVLTVGSLALLTIPVLAAGVRLLESARRPI
ncbi:MAG: ABC transporter permease subunit [Armatimonadota bacterium]|nr:ABC transporter permease subunit [Armatimonadota bacterium]MDR7534344.1 ABC transporter permease subunit [Armatimonadota bacterium]MDR7536020.1 ABC transporter permease subunit [Armatimonadota bacterium]